MRRASIRQAQRKDAPCAERAGLEVDTPTVRIPILNQADNTVIALDAETGELLWSVSNGYHQGGETMTMSPLVVGDKVIVGISGSERQ